VVFVSSNLPGQIDAAKYLGLTEQEAGRSPFKQVLGGEIAPVLVVNKLEEFKYVEATAVAVVLLVSAFVMLAVINWLERRCRRWDK
jgi:ABC-type sulfate transport system permease component